MNPFLPETEHEKKLKKRHQNTLKKRRQRKNIKNNPERYEAAKEKDKNRKKKSRVEEKKKLKANKKLATMKRKKNTKYKRQYRARKKMEKEQLEAMKKTTQRSKAAKKVWKGRKKAERKKEANSDNKLERAKKKNNIMRVQLWRVGNKLQNHNPDEPSTSGFTTPSQKCRSVKKVKASMPKTPEKRAEIIEKLSESPSCRHLLKRRKLLIEASKVKVADDVMDKLAENLALIKPKGGMTIPHKQTYTAVQQLAISVKAKYGYAKYGQASKLNVSWKTARKEGKWWLKTPKRKPRKDRIPMEIIEEIKDFYTDGMISKTDPAKRGAKKQTPNNEFSPSYIMTCTLEEAYEMYKSKYPERKVGFTSFKKAKPKSVRKVSETSKRSCLCQICCNASLKAEGLRCYVSKTEELKPHLKMVKMSKTDVCRLTVCDHTSKYARAACLNRTCLQCGPEKLSEYYKPIIENHENDIITWWKWKPITLQKSGGKMKRITSCQKEDTTLKEFMTEYKHDMQALPGHLFRATWQQEQRNICITSLDDNDAALVMDYAENYSCSFKDESQNAFFDKNQVTVHPMMLYYKTQGKDEQQVLVKHAVIGITDDDIKDAAGVRHFENEAIKIVQKQINLKKLHEWTDGCPSQYKGKQAFHDISIWDQNVTRNFFETSHGKSVCDGLGSTVKNAAARAVYSGKAVIGTARDLHQFCESRLHYDSKEVHREGVNYISKREFVFVDQSKVDHTPRNAKTLEGTRKLHSVKNIKDKPLHLESRNISCYCNNCIASGESCINVEYVHPWTKEYVGTSKPNPESNTAGQKCIL